MVTSKYYEKMAKLIEELGQENANLKAKLHNIEEGLKKFDELICGPDHFFEYDTGYRGIVSEDDYNDIVFEAPTLSLLIDKILTGGE